MEIIFFIAGVITSIVLTLLFLKKNNQSKKTFLDNEVNNDKNKYVTWSNALNLIKDQIIILNKNKVVIYANTAALTRFGNSIVSTHYASIIRDSNFVKAINNIYNNKKNISVNSEISLPTYQFLKANIYYIEQGFFDENFSIMVVLQDLTELLKIEKLKSDFVANVSHELRTPLQSIKLGFETISSGPAKDDKEAKKKFIDIMLNETNRMDQLITDLLTLSKIEQEEHKRPGDKINIRDVLNSVSSNLQTLSENKKINILNHVTENCFVIGDYNKLVEIFYNIVQNAIKYSNSNTQINITQFKNTDNVTIKVKDEGYGIPKTSIPRVTERFFRVDPEHSKKIGGTGLGLAIVKHLINQHRGEFHIDSEIGKGSEFFVKLPLHN